MPYLNGQYYEKWVPEEHGGKPFPPALEEAIQARKDYLLKWKKKYPLFGDAIDREIDMIDNHPEELLRAIGKAQNFTEADWDKEPAVRVHNIRGTSFIDIDN